MIVTNQIELSFPNNCTTYVKSNTILPILIVTTSIGIEYNFVLLLILLKQL